MPEIVGYCRKTKSYIQHYNTSSASAVATTKATLNVPFHLQDLVQQQSAIGRDMWQMAWDVRDHQNQVLHKSKK